MFEAYRMTDNDYALLKCLAEVVAHIADHCHHEPLLIGDRKASDVINALLKDAGQQRLRIREFTDASGCLAVPNRINTADGINCRLRAHSPLPSALSSSGSPDPFLIQLGPCPSIPDRG